MTEPLHVLIDADLPAVHAERIRRLDERVKLLSPESEGGGPTKSVLQVADVIYSTMADFDPAHAPRLRWVQLNTAAVNQILDKPIARAGIPIANVSGAYSVAVAECSFSLLLALTRRLPLACRLQAEKRWPEDYQPLQGVDLHGKTMGIVGYGSIGRQVARLAQAFGMKVLACKRRPAVRRDDSYLIPGTGDPEGTIPAAWFGTDQIAEMFRETDVAVVTVPLTPHTLDLIGKNQLAALPPHAYFLNVGRGPVVDEAALIEHLAAGELAGAGLDVFAVEPLPASSPLWTLPNVVIAPHIASWTDMQTHRAADVLLENLRRHLHGAPLINVIDSKFGY